MPPKNSLSLWACVLCSCISLSIALVEDGDSTSHRGVDSNSNSRSNWKDIDKNNPIDIDNDPEVQPVLDNRHHESTNYHEASGDGMRIGMNFNQQSKSRRNIRVDTERNETQVMVRCPSKSRFHFAGFASRAFQNFDNHYDDEYEDEPEEMAQITEIKYDKDALVKTGRKGIGVELDLMQLDSVSRDGPMTVDVEGCGRVTIGEGLPAWVEGVTFAIKGTLLLKPQWWSGGTRLKQMWVRVNEGFSEGEGGAQSLCHALPPTLKVLDVSHTPLGRLVVEKSCPSLKLHRLEATQSALSNVSLCMPSLVDLHISFNEMRGGLEWAGCEGGLGGIQYLKATHNALESASTHSYPSLVYLDVARNTILSLNLSFSQNLSILIASHNLLTTPPVLPLSLTKLDLSHNMMSVVPELTEAMERADISNNRIKVLGKGRFRRARRLHHLNLAHNEITHVHERELMGLRNLHTLDLSHNHLRSVGAKALHPLHNLRLLHLDHNNLKELDVRIFSTLPSHVHATVHHNPWYCNCQHLRQLKRLSHCRNCGHKIVSLECLEGESWVNADSVLKTCSSINAVGLNDESDEDLSEEMEDDPIDGKDSPGAMMVVPGLVVLLLAGVLVALSYRLYHRHRRTITTRLAPFCGFCGYCAPTTINNNHESHRRDQLSQIGNDSDTETEL